MADEDDEDELAVELGEAAPVSGAPIARVASRISWPKSKGDIVNAEGETEIRTADGPRELADILAEVELSYFARRQEFVAGIRDVIGYGPVPTEVDQ